MDLKKVLKKGKDIATRDIEGQVIIMPLHKSSKDLNCIYTLSKTAAAAWELIDGKNNLGQIKEALSDKFSIAESALDKQLSVLVKDLRSIKAIA